MTSFVLLDRNLQFQDPFTLSESHKDGQGVIHFDIIYDHLRIKQNSEFKCKGKERLQRKKLAR
jgi:hypothetical protein